MLPVATPPDTGSIERAIWESCSSLDAPKSRDSAFRNIKQLLELTDNIRTPGKKVRDFAEARLVVIRGKILDLKAMERALSELVGRCKGRGELTGRPVAAFVSEENITLKSGDCHE